MATYRYGISIDFCRLVGREPEGGVLGRLEFRHGDLDYRSGTRPFENHRS